MILGSNAVAEQASNDLGNVTAGQVSDGITLQRIPETDLVRITATDPSPSSAQDVANVYADAYLTLAAAGLDTGRAPEIENLNDAIAELEDRLAVVDADIAVAMAPFLEDPAGIIVPDIEQVAPTLATERAVLLEQYSQLLFNRNEIELGGEERLGSRVTEYATGSTIAAGPGSKLVVVVGLTAGAMIGALGAVVMSRLSGKVLDANDAASTLHGPGGRHHPEGVQPVAPPDPPRRPAAAGPRRGGPGAGRPGRDSVPSTEASRGALVVLVAGAERCSGATTIAVALAGHFADKDSEVLLVDADVLHPQLSDALGDGASGIGALLGNGAESKSASSPYIRTAATGVRFAGLGERHQKRSLRRQDVSVLLDGAAQHAQVVVIDGGALMASASSVELAQRADAVVLTMPARRQTRAGLEGVARLLASRRGGLLPVVTAARRRRHGTRLRTVAAEHGEAADGPVEHGEAADGPVEHGEAADGPVEHGEAADGPVEHGAADGPVEHEAADGPVEHGEARGRSGRAQQRHGGPGRAVAGPGGAASSSARIRSIAA